MVEAEESFAEPDRGHWHFVTGQPGWITSVTSSQYAFADSQEERGARVPTGSSNGVRRRQGTNVERRGDYGGRSPTYGSQWHLRDEDALFSSSFTSLFALRFEQTRQILDNVLHVEVARVNNQGNDSAPVTWLNSTYEYLGVRYWIQEEFRFWTWHKCGWAHPK